MPTIRLPGLVDPHVHLRDPGQTEKEDFLTGTKAALHGGYTTICDMPNNKEPITTKERLNAKKKEAEKKIVCDVGFYFGTLGDNLEEFAKVKTSAKGLKIYLNHTTGNFILDTKKLQQILKMWPENLPVLFHAEEETFDEVLSLVGKAERPLHLCHMSTAYELRKVMEAKERGIRVTCGVTPHHLFLTEADEKHLKGFGMMKPALKSRKDVDFLWKNLSAVDMIESDHAPHTREEKQAEPPAFGVPGLETTLPLLLTAAAEGRITIDEIIRLCSTNPRRLLGLTEDKTTFVEIAKDTTYEISNKELLSKCGWTPFDEWKVKGKVTSVTLRGTQVFDGEKILVNPGFGTVL